MINGISDSNNDFEIPFSALFTDYNTNPSPVLSKIPINCTVKAVCNKLKTKILLDYISGIKVFEIIKKSLMLADNRVLIACPYTDNNHIFLLLNELARKGVKVIVLTRIIDNGYSKAEHLLVLKKNGGIIFLNNSLHLKMYIIDNCDFGILINTSANLTASSLIKNYENAIITNIKTYVGKAKIDFFGIIKESVRFKGI